MSLKAFQSVMVEIDQIAGERGKYLGDEWRRMDHEAEIIKRDVNKLLNYGDLYEIAMHSTWGANDPPLGDVESEKIKIVNAFTSSFEVLAYEYDVYIFTASGVVFGVTITTPVGFLDPRSLYNTWLEIDVYVCGSKQRNLVVKVLKGSAVGSLVQDVHYSKEPIASSGDEYTNEQYLKIVQLLQQYGSCSV
jgi:hypothetical protein